MTYENPKPNIVHEGKYFQLAPQRDDRGCVTELFRANWFPRNDLLQMEQGQRHGAQFDLQQVLLSTSRHKVIRAWHRHAQGQDDLLTVIRGTVDIVYVHNGIFYRIRATAEDAFLVRIPGNCWHGTQCITPDGSTIVYFMNKLYDHAHPDEERLPSNHIFPLTEQPYHWE